MDLGNSTEVTAPGYKMATCDIARTIAAMTANWESSSQGE